MLTPRQIHERIAAHLIELLGWRESRLSFEQLFNLASTEAEHHGFALRLAASTPRELDRRRAARVEVVTQVRLRWVHRLRADAVVLDTLEAYDAEASLLIALRSIVQDPALTLVLQDVNRSSSGDGLAFLGEVLLSTHHHYPTE